MGCGIDTIREVLEEKGYKGDALELKVAEYERALSAENRYVSMRENSASKAMEDRLSGKIPIHYNFADPTKKATTHYGTVKAMEYDSQADVTKVIMDDNRQYTFAAGNDTSKSTKSKGTTISSSQITEAIKVGRDRYILSNRDMSDEEVDRTLLDGDITSSTILNVQAEMRRLDQDSTAGGYDKAHSDRLGMVVESIMSWSKNIANMKIDIDTSKLEAITEPYGQYNSATGKVSIEVRGNKGEEARNRFLMSNEETMVHEIVHAALDYVFAYNVGTDGEQLKQHIRRLYTQAKDKLTWESLLVEGKMYSEAEKAKAKERYDYIFLNGDANSRLQEFMAHLMTNKQLQLAMEQLPVKKLKIDVKPNESIFETMLRKFVDVVSKLFDNVKPIKGDNLLEEAVNVVYKLTEVQDKYGSLAARKRGFAINDKVSNGLNKVTERVNEVVTPLIDKLGEVTIGEPGKAKLTYKQWTELINVDNGMFPKKSDSTIKKWYKLMKVMPRIRLAAQTGKDFDRKDVAILWSKFFAHIGITEEHFVRELMADFSGGRKTLEQVTDLTMEFRSHVDRMREQGYKGTLHDIITGMFTKVDFRESENDKYNNALEATVMSSDLQALNMDADEISKLAKDSSKLRKEIEKIEIELVGKKTISEGEEVFAGQIMVDMSEASSEFMITGKGLRTNAENITRLFGTRYAVGYGGKNKYSDLIGTVDKLISLKALEKTSQLAKDTLVELIAKDSQGVTEYMSYARGLQIANRDEVKLIEPENYIKGQVRDTINDNKEVVIQPMTNERELKKQGYRLSHKLVNSVADNDKTKYGVFVTHNTYRTKRVDGTISLQRDKIPGLLMYDKVRMSNPHMSDRMIFKTHGDVVNNIANKYNANGYKEAGIEPVYGHDGQITDFRYVISKDEKITLLDLDTRGTQVIAKSEGHIGTRPMGDLNNRHILDIIYEDSKSFDDSGDAKKDTTHLFLTINAKEIELSEVDRKKLYKAGHSELIDKGDYGIKTKGEELWGLLPPDARKYVIEKNKQLDMEELKNTINIKGSSAYELARKGVGLEAQIANLPKRRVFRVRKDLVKQLFGYNEATIANSKLFDRLSEKERRNARIAESKFMEFASLLRSNVVVKLPKTIWNNIVSNAKFLYYSGMPVKKAFQLLLLSRSSLRDWKIDEKEIARLRRIYRDPSVNGRARLKSQIEDLEAKMASNPIKPLMDKGMYQSVVDDVQLTKDTNTISKSAEEAIDKFVGNNKINKAIQTLFLTRRSAAGKFLVEVTQDSDFHFRATTYWYGLEQGQSKEVSMRNSIDNFINYTKIINSKLVQWLERMGPEAFWKFFAGSQRVNLKLIKQSPTQVAIDKALVQNLPGTSLISADILDSNFISNFLRRINPYHGMMRLIDGGTEVPLWNAVYQGL